MPQSPPDTLAYDDPRLRMLRDAGYYWLAWRQADRALAAFAALDQLTPAHFAGAMGRLDCIVDLARWDDALATAAEVMLRRGHSSGTLAWCYYLAAKAHLGLGDVDASLAAIESAKLLDSTGVGKEAQKLAAKIERLRNGSEQIVAELNQWIRDRV